MSWTRNSSSVIIIALQKTNIWHCNIDVRIYWPSACNTWAAWKKQNNQSINCVDVSWGFRARPKSHFRHTFLIFIVKAIMVYISEILKILISSEFLEIKILKVPFIMHPKFETLSWMMRVLRNPWQRNILEEEKHIFIEESASQSVTKDHLGWCFATRDKGTIQ